MHVVMHHDMLSPLFHNSVLDVQHLQQVASLECRNRNQRPKLTHFWCEQPSVKSFDYAGLLFHGKTVYLTNTILLTSEGRMGGGDVCTLSPVKKLQRRQCTCHSRRNIQTCQCGLDGRDAPNQDMSRKKSNQATEVQIPKCRERDACAQYSRYSRNQTEHIQHKQTAPRTGFQIVHVPVRMDDSANDVIVVAMMACRLSSLTWAAIVFARIWKNGCRVHVGCQRVGFDTRCGVEARGGYVRRLRSSYSHWHL